ncbi:MAG TPA: hypothetical protein VMT63_04750 [Bacteroidales bacterium]|nr:hypothetical protein [Bacteroidales bacterium]
MKKRALRHLELIKHSGANYENFVPLETATIINATIKSKSSYSKLLNGLDKPSEFINKSILNSSLSYKDYEDMIEVIHKKLELLKEDEIKNTEKQIEEVKKRLVELKQ